MLISRAELFSTLSLAALASGAIWALLGRCEKAKAALRRGSLLDELRDAEAAIMEKAMRAGETMRQEERLALLATMRNFEPLAQLLGLRPVRKFS